MNCKEEMMERFSYLDILNNQEHTTNAVMGFAKSLYFNNTYQFVDYSKYDFNLFTEEEKRE